MAPKVNLEGRIFGKLKVISHYGRASYGDTIWLCKCDCGRNSRVSYGSLIRGGTKSCGCLKTKQKGLSTHPLFPIWYAMHQRCYNKANKDYRHYGGRGITVDKSWHNFSSFLADMGRRPSKKHSLDRIDNNLGYSKKNCHWETVINQRLNTRRAILITINGERLNIPQIMEKSGMSYHQVYRRYKSGKTISIF